MEPEINNSVLKQTSRKRLLLESAKNFAASSALPAIDFTGENFGDDISVCDQVASDITAKGPPKRVHPRE